MRQWVLASVCLACLGAGSPVLADGYTDAIVAELQGQGYSRIETEVTWLGRVRIVAERGGGAREIILNPRTGEILRDLWLLADGAAGGGGALGDDDRDDDGDDDAGDDHSGSGGGSDDGPDDSGSDNSGSGSDDSGSGGSGSDDD